MKKRRPIKRPSKRQEESELERKFRKKWNLISEIGLIREYKFHPKRMWRFDFAFPDVKLAIEIQGFGPGHNSYVGMKEDYEKHNSAVRNGWRVIYLMRHDLTPGVIVTTIKWIEKLHDRLERGESPSS